MVAKGRDLAAHQVGHSPRWRDLTNHVHDLGMGRGLRCLSVSGRKLQDDVAATAKRETARFEALHAVKVVVDSTHDAWPPRMLLIATNSKGGLAP